MPKVSPVDVIVLVLGLAAAAVFVIYAKERWDERRRAGEVAALAPSEEITQRTRPVLNVENRPLVEVVYRLGELIEESGRTTGDALRDVARVIQFAPDKVSDIARERLARVVEEHAAVIKRGGTHIREAGS